MVIEELEIQIQDLLEVVGQSSNGQMPGTKAGRKVPKESLTHLRRFKSAANDATIQDHAENNI